MESLCKLCKSNTFYQCIKCKKPVCNRPSCSSGVSEESDGYREEPPKRVSQCNDCSKGPKEVTTKPSTGTSSSKMKQSNVTSFFTKWVSFLCGGKHSPLMDPVRFFQPCPSGHVRLISQWACKICSTTHWMCACKICHCNGNVYPCQIWITDQNLV